MDQDKSTVLHLLCLVVLTLLSWVARAGPFEQGLQALEAGNFAEAYCHWRPLAEQGHADAAYHLGWLYANGNGLKVDVPTAMQWWTQAANQGHIDAMFALGMAFTTGEGIEQDADQALHWYLEAADAGHEDAREMIKTKVRSRHQAIRDRLAELINKPWLGTPVRITVDKANLRAGPGRGRKLLETVPRDTGLIAIDQRNNWYQVINPAALSYSWVASWLTDQPLQQGNKR
jgi:TPR repeat protein